jgi:hypothetical protein
LWARISDAALLSIAARDTSRGATQALSTETRLTSYQPITRLRAVRHSTPNTSAARRPRDRHTSRQPHSGNLATLTAATDKTTNDPSEVSLFRWDEHAERLLLLWRK